MYSEKRTLCRGGKSMNYPKKTFKQIMDQMINSLPKEDWDFISSSFNFQHDREGMKYSFLRAIEQKKFIEELDETN